MPYAEASSAPAAQTQTRNGERAVAAWLLACCALVFAMVVVGGVTRLTHSGLSIVEWQPIVGALPPLDEAAWQETFGKYKLTLCTCLPCGLQGALAAADHLREKLGIDFKETTSDGRFTLKEGECMGACAMAPVLLVNNKKMHDYMSNDKLDQLIGELK